MQKEVLMIFKTHLDIGYTDLSRNVVERYLQEFIPRAIRVGYALRGTDTPFVWTVGSWLIWEALKADDDHAVERAIRDGILTWHALPFTSHTELESETLFAYGLSLSRRLDARFGTHTVGAKMTDVPGHTIAMVPLLADHGVSFLHIGVNPATPLPRVPSAFRWRLDGREIVVAYQDGYGSAVDYGDFVLYFCHTNDNKGPQSPEEIQAIYEKVQREYPGAYCHAATLNDAAERMERIRDSLPVVTQEIGDTWIHGCGTDPKKIKLYRRLLRHIDAHGIGDADLSDNLLLVPEHTCGLCVQLYFPETEYYTQADFRKYPNHARKSHIEASWQEQRDYVTQAAAALSVPELTEDPCEKPDLTAAVPTDIAPDFTLTWEIFDRRAMERYERTYIQMPDEETKVWARWDFTKFGLPEYEGGLYTAAVKECLKKDDTVFWHMAFPVEAAETYGLPEYWVTRTGEDYRFLWLGKQECRLPQAAYVKFHVPDGNWQVRKLGRWIDPAEALGSPLILGTDWGVQGDSAVIESPDAVLVCPYGRRLYDFEQPPAGAQDLHFNLYNNVWNTNFPIWFSDDMEYAFKVHRR